MRHLVLALLLIAMSAAIHAAVVTGVVQDHEGEPLLEAAVKLLNPRDSSMVAGVTTNLDGRFTFKGVKAGKYVIKTSYIGYRDAKRDVTVGADRADVGTITMDEASNILKEVSVTGVKTAVKVMEDTVEFNADSYKTQPNAVVEDLLKRLPGVEVSSDGKITANGKEVSKILIDGKEFFSDDPKVASKNLPVNMVDKLQVVDRKSDTARLTGVDDGEDETVINLTVKKGMNNGWFGTAQAGGGTDQRFASSFNVNRFWNGNQVTLLGNLNNINELGFTDSNGGRFRRFGGDDGITTSRSVGLNFSLGRQDEKFRVGGDVMYSNTGRNTDKRQERTYLFPDSAAYSSSWSHAKDKSHNVRGDFRLLWKPDTLNTLEFRPSFSVNVSKSWNQDSTLMRSGLMERVNSSWNDAYSHGHSLELGGRLIFNHGFASHPGRSFSITGQYRLSNVREKETEYSINRFFLFGDSTDIYDQYNDNHTWSNQVMGQLTWTEPLGNVAHGNFLTFSYRMNYRWNNQDRLVYDYDGTGSRMDGTAPGDGYLFNDGLSNQFRNNFFTQTIRLGYKRAVKGLNLEAGLGVVPSMSQSTDLINAARSIDRRWVWNVAPFLRLQRKFTKTRSMMIRYDGRSSQPSMNQLQPVPDTSDPMNVIVGNPALDPTFTHRVMVRFQDFNSEAQRSIMLMGFFNFAQNSIVSNTLFNDETGGRTTTYENVNGVWTGRVMNMISLPFRNRAWTFTSHTFVAADRYVGFNNGHRNASLAFNINLGPGLRYTPDNFQFELRPRYSVQTTHNSLPSVKGQTVQTYGGMFDGTYYTPWGLTLQTDLNFSAKSGYAQGYNQKEWLWNASVSYEFLRNRSATITVKAYDLLQNKKNVQRTITANYIDDIDYNSLTRYFMVTLSWRFNTFGSGKEPGGGDFNHPGRPMGPPPGGRPGGGPGPRDI